MPSCQLLLKNGEEGEEIHQEIKGHKHKLARSQN